MVNKRSGMTAAEIVGLFADRESLERAINALLAAGFDRTDLSLLATHESLDAAGRPGQSWREAMTALVGELKYEGPLVATGAIFLAGGPAAAPFAGLIGAAVGGLAVTELLDKVTAKPHTEEFARSLAAGAVILWVRVEDASRADRATRILEEVGAANIHRVEPDSLPPTG